jgi:uncharacterized repeat protein (TIGR02543 family)
MKNNKILTLNLLLLFFTGLAFADESVTVNSSTTTMGSDDTETTYIVDSDITVGLRMTVYGTVTLHLNKGCTLTASEGITVPNTSTLIIEGDGTLNATANSNNAGIGGDSSYTSCGSVIINGGTITASGNGAGAGIGGGGRYGSNSCWCESIVINGGTITATGGSRGAGIGGGMLSGISYFEINGGKVTAKGGNGDSAGIGGGDGTYWGGVYGAAGTIIINGGEIEATSTGMASAIGAGQGNSGGASCDKVEINGGKITASSSSGNALGSASIDGNPGEIIINMTNPDDYLDMTGSSNGFRASKLTMGEKSHRLPDTGDDGRTVTYVDDSIVFDSSTYAYTLTSIKIVPYLHYTVHYVNQNFYLGIDEREEVFYGAKLEKPADPEKDGFTFGGWYRDRTFSTEWDFDSDLVEESMILYAKLIADNIKITTDTFFNYTGSAISVTPLVTSEDESISLTAGTDYTLTYKLAGSTFTSVTNYGAYTVFATGKGSYSGKSSSTTFYVIKNPSGSGSQEDPFLISSADDWSLLADNLSYGYSYSGKYISLSSDLSISSPLGSDTHPFDGIFLGNNHTICSSATSIFAKIKNASVSDFYTNISADSVVADKQGIYSISGIKTLYGSIQEGINKVISFNGSTYYIADMEVSNQKAVYVLTDGQTEINPVIKILENTLTLGSDYTISFVNNSTGTSLSEITDYGEYTATLTGCGNYTGTYSFDFKVSIDRNGALLLNDDGEYYINMPSDSSILTFDATDYEKGFTFKIYDNGGKGGSYFNNAPGNYTSGDGYLKITVPEGYLIHFSGYVATKSKYDYLTLYDGDDTTAATLYEKIHGENNENEYKANLSDTYTSSNTALLYFKGTIFSCEGLDITATIVNTKKIKAKKDEFTSGIYYTTFYTEEENFIADTNTRVFYTTEKEDGKINLTEDTDRIIKAGQGVILQSTASEINLYATNTNADYTSLLTGTVSEIESAEDSISGDVYIIGNSPKGGIGFYKWTGKIEANKAYLLIGD